MMEKLTAFERMALGYLASGFTTATHRVARACGFDKTLGDWATANGRNLLLRLEGRGLVAHVRTTCGYIHWWKITDAGRAAIARDTAIAQVREPRQP